MTPEQLTALRADFPDSVIGKLPREACGKCRSIRKGAGGKPWDTCERHTYHSASNPCPTCKGKHGSGAIHLDFVGHADVTDRLLSVDPDWHWEPMAFTDEGTPAIQQRGDKAVLWIRLTIGGVERIGVGTCEARKDDAEKELIGDALRNAAMRFGVALKLWSKSDLLESEVEGFQPLTEAEMTRSDSDRLEEANGGYPTMTGPPIEIDDSVKAQRIPKKEMMDVAGPLGITEADIIAKANELRPTSKAKDKFRTIQLVLARPAVARQIIELMEAGEFFNSNAEPFDESGDPTLIDQFRAFIAETEGIDQLSLIQHINDVLGAEPRVARASQWIDANPVLAEEFLLIMRARVERGDAPLPEGVSA